MRFSSKQLVTFFLVISIIFLISTIFLLRENIELKHKLMVSISPDKVAESVVCDRVFVNHLVEYTFRYCNEWEIFSRTGNIYKERFFCPGCWDDHSITVLDKGTGESLTIETIGKVANDNESIEQYMQSTQKPLLESKSFEKGTTVIGGNPAYYLKTSDSTEFFVLHKGQVILIVNGKIKNHSADSHKKFEALIHSLRFEKI
jgi:hypothetical protein